MQRFKVLRRVDAFIDYVAEIEAADAAEAAAKAAESESVFQWTERGSVQFDARLFVTLDANGCEMENTQTGDF